LPVLVKATRTGLSPRVRGSRTAPLSTETDPGSIPAGAGKPWALVRRLPASGVYPRWCGEASTASMKPRTWVGLSPLVRGSQIVGLDHHVRDGSIPAGAGKPRRSRSYSRRMWVYPRWCGEARRHSPASSCCQGLSPLVRGSRAPQMAPAANVGSIPAGAGKPP